MHAYIKVMCITLSYGIFNVMRSVHVISRYCKLLDTVYVIFIVYNKGFNLGEAWFVDKLYSTTDIIFPT